MAQQVKLKSQWDSLPLIGLAAQYFPDYANDRFQPHSVDVLLISVILEGAGMHLMRDQCHPETGASVAFTRCGELHSIVTAPGATMRIVNLYVDPSRLETPPLPGEVAEYLPSFWPAASGRDRAELRVTRIGFADASRIEAPALGIERELRERRPGCLSAAQDWFRLLLIECCRQVAETGAAELAARDDGTRRIGKLCRFLEEHCAEEHSLEELARRCGWQKNYLCRRFRLETGRTLSAWLRETRIRRARRELDRSEEKLLSIAWKCGFRDLSYFIRIFRRETGMTPAAYRRRLLK